MQIDQLGLQIGCPVQLQMLDDDSKIYTVQLIGFEVGEGIIISAPKASGSELSMILRDDQPLNVSINSFKYAISFRSKIIEKRLTPFPHMHIAVPHDLTSVARLQDEVIQVKQAITLINDDNESKTSQAELTGLSYQQATIVHRGHFAKKGQRITATLSFSFAGTNNVIVLEGVITTIQLDPVNHRDTLTLRYDELDQADKILLYAYIFERMLINMNILDD